MSLAPLHAPALPEDADYLRELGVTEQLDRDGDVVAAVRDRHPDGVDALLDLVSYAPGAFDGALRDGARVASSNGAAGEGPGRTNVMAVPSTDNLRRLAALLDDGTLQVHIHRHLRIRPRHRRAPGPRHRAGPRQARDQRSLSDTHHNRS